MTVLCYHAIDPQWTSPLSVHPEAFRAQVEWLARHRRVVELASAIEQIDPRTGRLPRGTVAITFDDGFDSVFDHALPILEAHGLPFTVFVVAQTLSPQGRTVDWVDTAPAHPLRTLAPGQVQEMRDRGVAFGSHSFAHADLTSLDEAACRRDLRASRELLEDLMRTPVPFLAYPRGLHNGAVRQAAADAGFTHGFALPESPEPAGPFAVPRVGIYPGNGVGSLRAKTAEWYLRARTNSVYPLLRRVLRPGHPPTRRLPG